MWDIVVTWLHKGVISTLKPAKAGFGGPSCGHRLAKLVLAGLASQPTSLQAPLKPGMFKIVLQQEHYDTFYRYTCFIQYWSW